jgi:hypothetical protein
MICIDIEYRNTNLPMEMDIIMRELLEKPSTSKSSQQSFISKSVVTGELNTMATERRQ